MSTPKACIAGAALITAGLVFHAWYPEKVALQQSEYARQHRENWINDCANHLDQTLKNLRRNQDDWQVREEVCGKGYAQNFPNGAP